MNFYKNNIRLKNNGNYISIGYKHDNKEISINLKQIDQRKS